MAKRPLDYNYAKDEDFARSLWTDVQSVYNYVESDRKEREDHWQENYRAWSIDRLESDKNYNGMSDIQLPQIRKEVETMSKRIMKGLFPIDYLKASPNGLAYQDVAQVNTEVVRHYLDNIMGIKNSFRPWIKQGVIYGTSPIRSFWKKDVNEMLMRERYHVSKGDGTFEPRMRAVKRDVTLYDAPVARVEDLFQTWVYPVTATRPEDIQITFWRTKVSKSDMIAKEKKGTAYNIDRFKDDGNSVDIQFDETQKRIQQFGENATLVSVQQDNMFTLMEVWMRAKLPDSDKPVPIVMEVINGSHVTRIQRNPYWHQQPPFDWFRYIIPPGNEFYGRGLPEAALSAQQQLNDTLNQGMDSATLALNNVTIVNPAFAPNAESFEVEPNAVWWADPNAVKQFSFPDLTDVSLKNTALLRTIITEMSENSPQLPDPLSGKARSTGQAQLALNEFQTDLLEIMDSLSWEGLKPFAKKIHIMLQQFLDTKEVIRITPKFAKAWINNVVTPEELCGDFDFTWMPAVQMGDTQVKVQQQLNLVRIVAQLKQQAGINVNINWDNFFLNLIREGFNIRNYHEIIETDRMDDRVSPDMEIKILEQGGEIRVNVNDDDQAHIANHRAEMGKLKDFPRAKLEAHITEHQKQMEQKQAAAAMQAAMLQAQQQQANGGGAEGNLGQVPEATSTADLQRGNS
jgi:hypothetical protein